jgi:dihydropyrimidinase
MTVDEHLAAPGFEGAKYVCSPPIRTLHDQKVLWQAVRDGTLQVVSTDHCDFWYDGSKGPWQEWLEAGKGTWAEFESQNPSYRRPGKELGKGNFARIPNGLPGIEDRMLVMWHEGVNTGRLSPSRFVELNCTNPAKIFGMYPKKGTISVGADADILVWDPEKSHTISAATHHMRVDYNLYEGWTIKGVPVKVYQRGHKLVDGDQWFGHNGGGQFVARKPHAPVL